MAVIDFKYLAGTIEAPQNTESTEARWSETDKVHFPDDKLTPIPSFAESMPSAGSLALSGTTRAQWASRLSGSTSISGAYYLFGTHSHLFAEYNATRYNMTPIANQKKETLGSDPLDTTSSDATLTIEIIAHGLSVGDLVTISGAADVGGVDANTYINIEHIVATTPSADSITVEMGTAAGSTATGGGDVVVAHTIAADRTLGTDPIETQYDATQTTPFATVSGNKTVTVTSFISNELAAGDTVTISGVSGAVNGIPDTELNASHTVVTAGASTFTITVTTAATSTGSPTITAPNIAGHVVKISDTAHDLAVGDRIKIWGTDAAIGGIPLAELNREHIVTTVTSANDFVVATATAPTSSTTGGGTAVSVGIQIPAGNQYQAFKQGFGAGFFNTGKFGTNRVSATTPAYPRISSFDNFGNKFLYCAGDYSAGDGQKIYEWDGDRDVAPTPVLDAPDNCNWVAVIANQIVALCDTNIVIGLTDPSTGLALWPEIPSVSPIGDVIPVQRATRLLSLAPLGEKSGIVFAPEPYLLRLVGGVWDLVELGSEFPIVSPAAWCRHRDGIVWYGQDGNYYFCNGGSVRKIVNRQNGEYVRARTNGNAIWTTFLMQDQKHDQFWHYYPSIGQQDPDSYVVYNPLSESFTTGAQDRTAAQRPSVVDQRFYTTDDETIYSSFTIDPTNFNWSAKTAFFFLDPEYRWKIVRLMPDAIISGEVNIKILGKEHPMDQEIDYGTYTMDSNTTSMTVRGAGRLIALEISGSGNFTLPNLKMSAERMGRRRL